MNILHILREFLRNARTVLVCARRPFPGPIARDRLLGPATSLIIHAVELWYLGASLYPLRDVQTVCVRRVIMFTICIISAESSRSQNIFRRCFDLREGQRHDAHRASQASAAIRQTTTECSLQSEGYGKVVIVILHSLRV